EGGGLIRATYAPEPARVTVDAAGAETVDQSDASAKKLRSEIIAGNADKAFEEAPVKIDARFVTAPQHHNPIELLATLAEWKHGKLTLHESTQNAEGVRHGLAAALGLTPECVEVISPFSGGASVPNYPIPMHTALSAVASP